MSLNCSQLNIWWDLLAIRNRNKAYRQEGGKGTRGCDSATDNCSCLNLCESISQLLQLFFPSSSSSNWNFKFKFRLSNAKSPSIIIILFLHSLSLFIDSLAAGLCEGYHRNALVQAAQLAVASGLHTALWRCTLLQRRGQYAVSTRQPRVMNQLVLVVTCSKHIHKIQPHIRQMQCIHRVIFLLSKCFFSSDINI